METSDDRGMIYLRLVAAREEDLRARQRRAMERMMVFNEPWPEDLPKPLTNRKDF